MKDKGIKRIILNLMNFIKPHKTAFFLGIIYDLIAVAMNMTIPLLAGYAIDTMVTVGQVDFKTLIIYIVAIFIITCFSSLFDWLGSHYTNILSYRTIGSMRNAVYHKLNNVPIRYIDNTAHGDIMNTMINDVENISDGFLVGFKAIVCGVFQILTVMVMMLVLNWILALVVILLAPISLVLAIKISRKSKKLYTERVQKQAEISAYSEEMILNMKIVKAFHNEDTILKRFEGINEDLRGASEKSTFYATLAYPMARLVNGILYGLVGVVGALLAIKGKVRIGIVSSFLNYSENFTKPFNSISDIFANINMAIASANRVFDLLDEKEEISDVNLVEMHKCNGEVKLQNVDFSYEESFKLIEGLNLEVRQGERVAIVGPTGCGKSTIINLLMRFYDVNSGSIKVSNRDIRKVKRNSFRKFYGMVLQESWVYNASIKDNVAYGKPDASFDEIVEACKLANAHQFIEKMPQGYDTIITENGDNISAGQKQLLCIARIMLLKPPMMILDEATSNIDTRTEQKIQQALDLMMEGKTCFIVAHRLSTIENADMILVMNKGHIIEQGTHKDLLAKKGFYYRLFNSQFGV